MSKFKSYSSFINENISDIFKDIHGAIDTSNLEPLSDHIGRSGFPTQQTVDEVVEFMKIDPKYLYFVRGDRMHPICYWKGPIFYGFFGGHISIESLKMMRANESIAYQTKTFDKYLKSKDYESLFARVEKKILIPLFIEMYKEIPDDQKYNVFTDLYVRSEYGFQLFPIEIIKDLFSKRKLSSDWKKRMEDVKKEMTLKNGLLTIYRGGNLKSSKIDDAFSWTLSKKTAKFFADRFEKGAGKIISKEIDPSEIIDYLPYRGESEIILFPKKFGKINETLSYSAINGDYTYGVGNILPEIFDDKIVFYHWSEFSRYTSTKGKTKKWFTLDKDSKFIPAKGVNVDSKWAIGKIHTAIQEIPNLEYKHMIPLQQKIADTLMSNQIFIKWYEAYRGYLTGKKYGI